MNVPAWMLISGPLGNMDVKWMWLSYLPGNWMPNWMWLSHLPRPKMSCFVWVWDDVMPIQCGNNCLALQGRSCETPQFVTTDTQTREHRGQIQFAPHFQFLVLMDVRLGLISLNPKPIILNTTPETSNSRKSRDPLLGSPGEDGMALRFADLALRSPCGFLESRALGLV